jgi:hypothetical protein
MRYAFTTSEKSYGGYSTHSLPTRNAEKSNERDVPKYVHDKVKEIKKKQKIDDSKAWAVAWSIFCKYKKPGDVHCQKPAGEYFKGRKAGGYDKYSPYSQDGGVRVKQVAKYVLGIMYEETSKALLHIFKQLESQLPTELVKVVSWMWTTKSYSQRIVSLNPVASALGEISRAIMPDPKPRGITSKLRGEAEKVLETLYKSRYLKQWEIRVAKKVNDAMAYVYSFAVRMEVLSPANKFKHGLEYGRLLYILDNNT